MNIISVLAGLLVKPISPSAREAWVELRRLREEAERAEHERMMAAMQVGHIVVKDEDEGAGCIGRVVAVYEAGSGLSYVVVESIVPGARRIVHIYRPDKLRPATAAEIIAIDRMTEIWDGRGG